MWRAVAVVLVLAACSPGAKSPEEARGRLRSALERGDAAAVFDLLDQETRWSIESTWKYHQRCLRLIEENYPPEEQARAAGRFLDADRPAAFLAAYDARYQLLAGPKSRMGALAPGDFAIEKNKRWGYTGLRAQWEDIKQRASKDGETVERNATAYEREARTEERR